MLRSKRKIKDMEGIIAILSEDFDEALAESLVVRYLSRPGEMEKFREGLSMLMTSREAAVILHRIELEMGGVLSDREADRSEAGVEE